MGDFRRAHGREGSVHYKRRVGRRSGDIGQVGASRRHKGITPGVRIQARSGSENGVVGIHKILDAAKQRQKRIEDVKTAGGRGLAQEARSGPAQARYLSVQF